jgi:NAD(P)H-nitrite reductase large subunit
LLPVNWETAPDDTTVCWCNEVSLGEIKNAVQSGATTLEDIQEMTGACAGNRCEEKNPSGGCCETDIRNILALFGKGGAPGGKCGCCHG